MPMSEAVNEVGVVSDHSSVPVAVPEKAPSFIRRFLLRFGFAFVFLIIYVPDFAAISRSTTAAGASGVAATMGRPAAPASRTRWSSGT